MTIFAPSEDFFPEKRGDMRVESMVIRKYYRFSTNTKINAKSCILLMCFCNIVKMKKLATDHYRQIIYHHFMLHIQSWSFEITCSTKFWL